MKKTTTILLSIFLLTITSCGSAKLTTVIDKGKIDDDISIHFTDKNITIKPDEFFKLEELNLQAGAQSIGGGNILDAYRNKSTSKYPNYNITIDKPGHKTYYGKIAFFNAPKKSTEAVTRYYQLHVPDSYFKKSTGGRVACVYEYSTSGTGKTVGSKITKAVLAPVTLGISEMGGHKGKTMNPTWIIWLSDTPL